MELPTDRGNQSQEGGCGWWALTREGHRLLRTCRLIRGAREGLSVCRETGVCVWGGRRLTCHGHTGMGDCIWPVNASVPHTASHPNSLQIL